MANILTIARIVLGVVFFCLILAVKGAEAVAFVVFAVAGVTDFLDGYVARRLGRLTTLGRLADPFADRLLVVAGIVALYFRELIPLSVFVALVGRDVILILGYVVLRMSGRTPPKINLFGKVINFYLMVAMSLMFFQLAFVRLVAIDWLFYLGVLFYLVSGLVYIVESAQMLFGWKAER